MQIKDLKKSNDGFSLIELLVVVAIMAVLMVGALITWHSVSSANVNKASSYMEDALTECKNRAMTTSAYKWSVVLDGSKVQVIKYVEGDSGITQEVILTQELPKNVYYIVTASNGSVSSTFGASSSGSSSITINFKLLSGGVSSVYFNNDEIYPNGGSSTYTYLDITSQYQKKGDTIRLYFETGKVVEQ